MRKPPEKDDTNSIPIVAGMRCHVPDDFDLEAAQEKIGEFIRALARDAAARDFDRQLQQHLDNRKTNHDKSS